MPLIARIKEMIEAGDVVRIVISWLINNADTVQMVFHYLMGSGSDQDASDVLSDIVASLAAGWVTHAEDQIVDNLQADIAEMYVFNTGTGNFDGVATQTHTMDGAATTTPEPNGVAALIKFFTAIGRYQGRKYIPGLRQGTVGSDGVFNATAETAFALLGADWNDIVTSSGVEFQPGVFNAPANRFTPFIQTAQADTVPAYQRRRRNGVGI